MPSFKASPLRRFRPQRLVQRSWDDSIGNPNDFKLSPEQQLIKKLGRISKARLASALSGLLPSAVSTPAKKPLPPSTGKDSAATAAASSALSLSPISQADAVAADAKLGKAEFSQFTPSPRVARASSSLSTASKAVESNTKSSGAKQQTAPALAPAPTAQKSKPTPAAAFATADAESSGRESPFSTDSLQIGASPSPPRLDYAHSAQHIELGLEHRTVASAASFASAAASAAAPTAFVSLLDRSTSRASAPMSATPSFESAPASTSTPASLFYPTASASAWPMVAPFQPPQQQEQALQANANIAEMLRRLNERMEEMSLKSAHDDSFRARAVASMQNFNEQLRLMAEQVDALSLENTQLKSRVKALESSIRLSESSPLALSNGVAALPLSSAAAHGNVGAVPTTASAFPSSMTLSPSPLMSSAAAAGGKLAVPSLSSHVGMSPVVAAAHRFVHPVPPSSSQPSAIASSPALSHAVSRNTGTSSDSSNRNHSGRTALFTDDGDESVERQYAADRDESAGVSAHATPVARPRHGSAASVSLVSAARRAPNAVVHASHAHHTRDTAAKTAVADLAADADLRLAADPSATRSPSSAVAVSLSSSAMTLTGLRVSSQRYANSSSSEAAVPTFAAAAATASAAAEVDDSVEEPASPPMAMRFHTRPPPSYASMLRTAMAAAALEGDDASGPHASTQRSAFGDDSFGDYGEFDGDSARGRCEQSYGASQSFFLPTPADITDSPARLALQRESASTPSPMPSPVFVVAASTESSATPARKILGRTFLPSRSTPASAVASRAVSVASSGTSSAMDS